MDSFTWIDWLLCYLVLLVVVCVGWYRLMGPERRQRDEHADTDWRVG